MSKAIQLLKKKNLLTKNNVSNTPPELPPTIKLNQASQQVIKPANQALLSQSYNLLNPASVKLGKSILGNSVEKTAPDISNQFIEPYSNLEKTVQGIEAVNDFVTNMAFGANALNYVTPSSRLARSTQSFGKLGKPANQVQAGLYAVDTARALVDPEYRSKVQDGINKMFDNSQGDIDLTTTAFTYGSQRPLAFTAGLLRNVQNTRAEINRLEAEGKLLSQRIEQKKLNQQSSITPKGNKNIGDTGVNYKDFMDIRRDQGLILNQAKNYRNQMK